MILIHGIADKTWGSFREIALLLIALLGCEDRSRLLGGIFLLVAGEEALEVLRMVIQAFVAMRLSSLDAPML
jgi:hypothetical protein